MNRILLLLPAAVVSLGVIGCGGDSHDTAAQEQKAPVPVTVAVAERVSESANEEFMGTVTARNQATIEAKVQARVERIPVALGTRVNKGDLLAELDTREFEARVAQARAVFEQADQDLKRFETLLQQQAATQQEFDGVKARHAVAKATLTEAETYLSYTRVLAPFAGTVTQKTVDVGDQTSPGRPMFTIEGQGVSQFVVTLPESKLGQLTVGDSLRVSLSTIDTIVKGRVEEVSPSADPVSRTFMVKMALPNAPGIRPGQFGRLLIPAGGDETIFIPRNALVKRGQLDLVYVVNAEHKAMLRLVRIGRQYPDRLEVLSGLRENERVVVTGQRDLSDGDPVTEQS